MAHWVTSGDARALKAFVEGNSRRILMDIRGTRIFMSDSPWSFERVKAANPAIRFYSTSEIIEERDASA